MSYAIDLLGEKLEDSKAMYDQSKSAKMQEVYKEEVEDLVLAIHNLKMLES